MNDAGSVVNIPARATDWIMTSTGRRFWPLDPRVEDVDIEDIAHHLSNLCRFTGAVRTFYSVAQHSVLVSQALFYTCSPTQTREAHTLGLYGLLHDASEAYLIDVPRPLKHAAAFGCYRVAEKAVSSVVYDAFGLSPVEPEAVKVADRRILRTEQRDLMPPAAADERRDDAVPYEWVIRPISPEAARAAFLYRFQYHFGVLNKLGAAR